MPRVFDDHVDIDTYLHVRGDPKNPDKDRKIDAGVPAILASFATDIQPIALPVSAYAPGTRKYVQDNRLEDAQQAVATADASLAAAKKKLEEMTGEKNKAIASVSDAESAVTLAEAKLAAANATVRSIEATIAADNAKFGSAGSAIEAAAAAKLAARRQAEEQKAPAAYQLLADASDSKKTQRGEEANRGSSEETRGHRKG